ncbi:PREDICTED: uncharacterized protein LOC106314531 [Brassica oleracea var. oleracea]|uniref:uncharacterized protein LOC106314531 n=1 Tax=Brassica oleracea var. oleracea TaxID=109376 RepID=UPI0006A6AB08|nr:PREDICTED: uncharacterized protein LOC106314531 [Brassica oleracea var. oleracea]
MSSPHRGFEYRSLYENFSHLLDTGKDSRVPKDVSCSFSWILWMLWKNKNAFNFEGKEYEAEDTVTKCREESRRWTEVVATAKAETGNRNQRPRDGNIWIVPKSERVKCNIGISWSKVTCMSGLGWIVRNSEGETLLHSRRTINGVSSLLEARRLGLIWAAESMNSHKVQKVCFELEDYELVGSVNKPKAWPAFRAYGEELRDVLNKVTDWKVSSVKRVAK